MTSIQLGDARITKILEAEREPESYDFVFPRGDWRQVEAYRSRLEPDHIDCSKKAFLMSFHSYVISLGGINILVDGCIGNHKNRSGPGIELFIGTDYNYFHMRETDYLKNLTAAGFHPNSIDYVMCTHLHCDHIGWFTHKKEEHWVPTFPNARYIFAKKEYDGAKAAWEKNPDGPFDRSFADSVQPVVEAGLVDFVNSDHQIRD